MMHVTLSGSYLIDNRDHYLENIVGSQLTTTSNEFIVLTHLQVILLYHFIQFGRARDA